MKRVVGLAARARSGKDTAAAFLQQHPEVTAYALADPLKRGCQALFNLSDSQTWDDNAKEIRVGAWGLSPREFFQRVGTEWMRGHNLDHWLMRADREIYAQEAITPVPAEHLSNPDLPFILGAKAFFGMSDKQCWEDNDRMNVDPFWQMTPSQMIELVKTKALTDFPDFFAHYSAMPEQDINTSAFVTKPALNTQNKNIIIIKDIRFENEAAYIRKINGVIWHIVRKDAEPVNQHSSESGIAVQDMDTVIHNDGTIIEYRNKLDSAWASLSANARGEN
ncbi:deoxynucleotide monophosphate kinase [Pseudomonas argentinensis]|uniref:deoxynucleotide monophosphate kinase family protein n=1 Tax=Phytopseudomonas argentinensis TaxID=289370 RepID=UPI0009F5A31C|nr:deoxynucleotide monophosphate kinase [Pseudomonas argentinensis]